MSKHYRPKTIDLFCGCGGMTLGFEKAGFRIVAGFDNWPQALKVYEDNFPRHEVHYQNLEIDALDFMQFERYKPDVIIGGPPCQDFSSAGKRNERLGRADLTIAFATLVQHVKPHFFVMENVERIKKSSTLAAAMKLFRRAGYGLTARVLDASLCGVPQKRKRFFLVGELHGYEEFLGPFLDGNLASKAMTVRDYLGDSLGIEYYYRHPRSYQRRSIFSIDEPSPTVRGVNRPVPSNYKKHPGDKVSITAKIRPLTTIERSYIQTFPTDFKFEGSKTDLELMIGNAVPVKLAEYVAKCLRDYMVEKEFSGND
jgi:DNA (cytosine-5)-methyltransferase 1